MKYINSDNYIGLVSYSNDVTIELPIGKFDLNQQSLFKGAVENLYANGGTATFDGICVAMDMINKAMEQYPDAKPMLFVLSDGETNSGDVYKRQPPLLSVLHMRCIQLGREPPAVMTMASLSTVLLMAARAAV